MARRRFSVLLVFVLPFLLGAAEYRTRNFIVKAPTAAVARQIGDYAEMYRRQKAIQWLGKEMPPWPQRCPLHVKLGMNSGGATSFAFEGGQILGQRMNIEGKLDRLLMSVLPHEITHTVFAHHFRQPVPRWADEGGSVLSEDEPERRRHDQIVRRILSARNQAIPLRRLFSMREYPSNVMSLYAQGYSVTEFLVSRSSRPAFLNFVSDGMYKGWDYAVKAHYDFESVEALERAWVKHVWSERPSRPAGDLVARERPAPRQRPTGEEVVVRQSVPPAQALREMTRPVVRGQSGDPDDRYDEPFHPTSRTTPGTGPHGSPPNVRLGPPEPIPPTSHLGQPVPELPRR